MTQVLVDLHVVKYLWYLHVNLHILKTTISTIPLLIVSNVYHINAVCSDTTCWGLSQDLYLLAFIAVNYTENKLQSEYYLGSHHVLIDTGYIWLPYYVHYVYSCRLASSFLYSFLLDEMMLKWITGFNTKFSYIRIYMVGWSCSGFSGGKKK